MDENLKNLNSNVAAYEKSAESNFILRNLKNSQKKHKKIPI